MKLVWDERNIRSVDPDPKLGFEPFSTHLPKLKGYRVFYEQEYLLDCELLGDGMIVESQDGCGLTTTTVPTWGLG